MDIFKPFLSNSILFCALYSWVLAQFLKIIIELIKKNKLKTKDFIFRVIFGTGGMPSSHSATIVSVATSIGIREGFNSSLFALAVVMVIIIIRDATGVRLSAGKQAEAINKLLAVQYKNHKIPFNRVKEVRGHTPLETFVGALIGILVSLGMNLIV